MPALDNLVIHIVGISTQEQMLRITAGRVVTMVEDFEPRRDRPVGVDPNQSVGVAWSH